MPKAILYLLKGDYNPSTSKGAAPRRVYDLQMYLRPEDDGLGLRVDWGGGV